MDNPIRHVFVLMLENRSFDHMFGFSGLKGSEPGGQPTAINGLKGNETNVVNGKPIAVSPDADFVMPSDPGHEFADVLEQLCGVNAKFKDAYPVVNNSGFVESYVRTGGAAKPGEIMRCFNTEQNLPVLFDLASEFAICDNWFASIPGPTWPNRMFAHAASSGGLEHSPTTAEILEWELVDGFSFPNGTIFDQLKSKGISYHFYSGDEFPMASALKGVTLDDVQRIPDLLAALKKDSFPYSYVFIEPSYDVLNDYRHGSSQHPLSDVRSGEALVKQVYEALRASKAWPDSILVVVWDEHGGFFDHVEPGAALPPGDAPHSKYNRSGFSFDRYGVRVPAIIVSPRIPKGTIDHRVYDHASIPATLEALWGLTAMTARDAGANILLSLLSLASPRQDAPLTLRAAGAAAPAGAVAAAVTRPLDMVNANNLPSILHAAVRQDLLLAPSRRSQILQRVAGLKTRQEVAAYLKEVQGRRGGAPWTTTAQGAPAPTLRELATGLLAATSERRPLAALQSAVDELARSDALVPGMEHERDALRATIAAAQSALKVRLDREGARYLGGLGIGLLCFAVLVVASSWSGALARTDAKVAAGLVSLVLLIQVALSIRRLFEIGASRDATTPALEYAKNRLGAKP